MKSVRNLTGETFRGWRLSKILGSGIDGIVYLGEKDEQRVAVKLFFPERLEKSGTSQETERLELQLTLKGKKHHPNLVEIFDGGSDSELGTLYLIMEFVPGTPLDKLIGKLPKVSIPPLLRQLASAAQFLESQELVHRDIKPANIVVSDDLSHLTLLDLGVVLSPLENSAERLSGEEFVASLRYSPREFVWRTEISSAEAWRAVTFYQIGATLHDMITGSILFAGFDKPRACLYDAVKLRPPELDAGDCPQWLVRLAMSCLVKSWEERLKLVKWDAFAGPAEHTIDLSEKVGAIRLRQIRAEEFKLLKQEEDKMKESAASREKELWQLCSNLFIEVRDFLMTSGIFPKFSGTHESRNGGYALVFTFEAEPALLFAKPLVVEILLEPAQAERVSDLTLRAHIDGNAVYDTRWTELFDVESAANACKSALTQVAEQQIGGE